MSAGWTFQSYTAPIMDAAVFSNLQGQPHQSTVPSRTSITTSLQHCTSHAPSLNQPRSVLLQHCKANQGLPCHSSLDNLLNVNGLRNLRQAPCLSP